MSFSRISLGPLVLLVITAACSSSESSGGSGAVASTCEAATGPGTTHASLSGDETWSAADSPHVVSAALSIAAGSTLTIEPCAVVQIQPNVGMLVEGKLEAVGAADKPIRFERAGSSAWTSIETRKGAELRMAYTTVEGGGFSNGGRPTQFGALDIRGDQDVAPQPIFFADHVTVKGSESLGIWMREGGAFASGSQDLTITGGASFPIEVWARAAGTLPTGTYTGNGEDEIFLPANGGRDDIQEDTTLADHGVPYRVGGDTGGSTLTVGAKSTVPLLTIDPGVTLRFAKETRLFLSNDGDNAIGALHAVGTADKPIIFTSAEASPAAGDWPGILIAGAPDSRDAIAYATIGYGGGLSGISSFGCPSPLSSTFANEGAVVIHGGQPSGAFVTNTSIEHSAGEGIVRGWTGDPIDFLSSNTFTDVARCNQTFPKPTAGVCPSPTECPK